jgi:peptidyl-prolyl cis-trans isomerase D
MDSLIATEVLFQSAEKSGFAAPDKAVLEQLVGLSYFQEEGRFSRETYVRLLEANGLTPAAFEASLRRQVALNEVRDSFLRSLRRPKLIKDFELEAKAIKLNLEFIRFERSELDVGAAISDAEVDAFLASTEGKTAVQAQYNSKRADFTIPKEVHARHILIKSGQGRSDAEALKTIKEIRAKATVENFADLAKTHSEDEGSKGKGGDLGFFGKGRMVPEFEDVAMGLAPHTISEPVKSDFGYHLILVEDARGGNTKPLEEVQKDIARDQLSGKIRDEALANLEKAVTGNQNIQPLLQKYKLKWEETGEFDLAQPTIPKLGGAPEVVAEAVRLQKSGQLVPKLIRADGKIHIVKLKTYARKPVDQAQTQNEFTMAPMQALEKWTKDLQQSAKIKRNTSLLEI